MNMEMGSIRRILKRAKRWHIVAEDIHPLKERRNVGQAMAHEEKIRLLRTAAMQPGMADCPLRCNPCSQHNSARL